jgi:hypothetical protein
VSLLCVTSLPFLTTDAVLLNVEEFNGVLSEHFK